MYIVWANDEANDDVDEKENEWEKEQQIERNKWKQVVSPSGSRPPGSHSRTTWHLVS
jgi:hypothetical protein